MYNENRFTTNSLITDSVISWVIALKCPFKEIVNRPTVTISPKYAPYEVIENTTNLVLDCTVTDANPTATSYRWYKDGFIIDGSSGASYTIAMVLRSHTGRYTCGATNFVGSSDLSADVQLNVLYRPTVTVFPDHNHHNVIENTTNLQLTCTVTDANPAVTSYRWYKGNLLMSNIMSTYTIPTVQRSHTGNYTCDATNSVGTSIPSSALRLNVLCKPRTHNNLDRVDILIRATDESINISTTFISFRYLIYLGLESCRMTFRRSRQ
ncbi:unnamed protein product [Mytilus edulis]|uniref:Ig-like domain-containing protein n=1 Tax=Mytilus edulis TaxID=6550 RepID=A0A8S3RPT0_MYTED|nr:unnamed protein product [Mytilus edulis]